MTILISLCIAVIFAVSVYLLLGRELKGVAMGVFLLSHGAHLGIIAMSGQPLVSMFQGAAADEVADLPGPAADQPDRLTANGELSALVHEALDRLPERQARALELKYVDGYSSKEIARELAVSDEAVQSLLARARRAFRDTCDERIVEAMGSANGSAAGE